MIIENLNYDNIGDFSRKYPEKVSVDFCRKWIGTLIKEPMIIDLISDELLLKMYYNIRERIEDKIESLIFDETGEKRLPIGIEVIMLSEFGKIKKGDHKIIKASTRFEQDNFNQGWYIYQIEDYQVYPHEFIIDKNAKD